MTVPERPQKNRPGPLLLTVSWLSGLAFFLLMSASYIYVLSPIAPSSPLLYCFLFLFLPPRSSPIAKKNRQPAKKSPPKIYTLDRIY